MEIGENKETSIPETIDTAKETYLAFTVSTY